MAEFCTFLLIVLAGWWIVVYVKNSIPQSENAGADIRAKVTVKGNNLVIKTRHSSLKDAFEVNASREVNVSYTPDRYVYTGATVGGVTTGGVTKLDGGYSLSTGAKTGDYYLTYKYGQYNEFLNARWSSRYVSAISLTKTDFCLAEKNSILRKYIPSEEQRKRMVAQAAPRFSEEEAETSLLVMGMSKSDAEYVIKWLSKSV